MVSHLVSPPDQAVIKAVCHVVKVVINLGIPDLAAQHGALIAVPLYGIFVIHLIRIGLDGIHNSRYYCKPN